MRVTILGLELWQLHGEVGFSDCDPLVQELDKGPASGFSKLLSHGGGGQGGRPARA